MLALLANLMVMASAARIEPVQQSKLPFDDFFTQHYAFVWRSLVHLGLDASTAEDASQEVFLVVHRRYAELQPGNSERAWLYAISRRVASTLARSRQRQRRKQEALAEASEQPGDLSQRLEVIDTAQKLLAALPAEQREILLLIDVEGFSAPEVAEATELKLNTVYSRLRLARHAFNEAYRSLEEGHG